MGMPDKQIKIPGEVFQWQKLSLKKNPLQTG